LVNSTLNKELIEISNLKSIPSLIDGNFIFGDKSFNKFNPLSGEVDYEVCQISKKEYEDVIYSLKNNVNKIESSTFYERSEIILKASKLIEENIDILSKISSSDSGKTEVESSGEIYGSVKIAHYFGTEWMRSQGEILESSLNGKNTKILRHPLGIAGLITAFNAPLPNITWKVFPAIFCGNSVVLKPSEFVPKIALALGKILINAGLDPKNIAVLNGGGKNSLGEWIVDDKNIDIVSFTGSLEVGQEIASKCSKLFKRYSLELGGKNAIILDKDLNQENALNYVIQSVFSLSGQRCSAASKIFIHEDIYVNFLENLTKRIQNGIKKNDTAFTCPLITKESEVRIKSKLNKINEENKVLFKRPSSVSKKTYYVEPTLLIDLSLDHEINSEELFGPVATINKYRDIEKVLDDINNSNFGLTCSFHTNNLNLSEKFIKRAKIGTVNINLGTFGSEPHYPFGGFRFSGNGTREPGIDSLDVYSEKKVISIFTQD
tara:strand:+ start:19648 stop:21120 length:1473 start_codon:yes stop_codon:yes gene_type:complete